MASLTGNMPLGHPPRANFWLTLRAHLQADGGHPADLVAEIRYQAVSASA